MADLPAEKKPLIHHTFIPAIIVILSICAFLIVAFIAWWLPKSNELNPTAPTVLRRAHKTVITNTSNTNTTVTNTANTNTQ